MTVAYQPMSYEQALASVVARVTASRTSFHAGMAILPKVRRDAMFAFYAFCREVDDIADDSPTTDAAARGLETWRQRIMKLFRGMVSDDITAALQPAIMRFGLIEKDFQDIIDGMAMDAGKPICAPDEATLDLYCDRVASAVGRVSVRIFGDDSTKAMLVAHNLGRAFQLTNILRDLSEDAARERFYLPQELLTKHGIKMQAPAAMIADHALRSVCRELAARAAKYYADADQAMRQCKPSAMRPARIMRGYYGAIFDRLVAEDWRDPATRVSLPKWQKLWVSVRALVASR
jgi:phytoene synthase